MLAKDAITYLYLIGHYPDETGLETNYVLDIELLLFFLYSSNTIHACVYKSLARKRMHFCPALDFFFLRLCQNMTSDENFKKVTLFF